MNHELVRELEDRIAAAIAGVFQQSRVTRHLSRNQPPPDDKTLHLMAKAAVTVFEATEYEREP
jgi:hypothetical protein